MSAPPIPRRLLGSDCEVREPADGRRGGEFGEPRRIRGVRFEPSSAFQAGDYSASDPDMSGTLYIDAVASEGAFEPPVGSLVSVDGSGWCAVRSVRRVVGEWGRVHHWEVEVA